MDENVTHLGSRKSAKKPQCGCTGSCSLKSEFGVLEVFVYSTAEGGSAYLCLSVEPLADLFVPEGFPAVLQPLETEEDVKKKKDVGDGGL